MAQRHSRGVLFCLAATVAWGGMFPVMNAALRHIDPFTFTCLRYSTALAVFVVLLWRIEGRTAFTLRGERVGLAFLFGTAGFCGFQFLVFYGQQEVGTDGALTASIMMATMPLLGFLVTWAIRQVLPPRGALGFIAMSFVGISLVVTKGHYGLFVDHPGQFGADGLIVLGAFFWVLYTAGATFYPSWSPVRYTTITTALGLVSTLAVTGVLVGSGAVAMPGAGAVGSVLPELGYMSLVAAVVGVLAWNTGNRILTPLNGVLFMDVVPVTSFAISAATGTLPTATQVVGACISATALVLNNL